MEIINLISSDEDEEEVDVVVEVTVPSTNIPSTNKEQSYFTYSNQDTSKTKGIHFPLVKSSCPHPTKCTCSKFRFEADVVVQKVHPFRQSKQYNSIGQKSRIGMCTGQVAVTMTTIISGTEHILTWFTTDEKWEKEKFQEGQVLMSFNYHKVYQEERTTYVTHVKLKKISIPYDSSLSRLTKSSRKKAATSSSSSSSSSSSNSNKNNNINRKRKRNVNGGRGGGGGGGGVKMRKRSGGSTMTGKGTGAGFSGHVITSSSSSSSLSSTSTSFTSFSGKGNRLS